jgi:polyketide-type polyunsaturated fatty acid synthase PfaA
MVKKSMANKQNTTSVKTVKAEETLTDEQQFNSRLQECPIAVVGMASIFADAKNLEDYWDNIFESVDAIKDVPSDRWDIDDYYNSDPRAADKTYCKRGGFLPEIDFDPMEFGLPPNILELTDIAQLLSLVVARDVLNDAGIGDGSGYDRDKVGITLGVGGGQKQISPLTSRLQGPVLEKVLKASGVDAEDRAMIIEKFKKAYIGWEENSFPGMLGNVISGRIANRFDFGGTNCVVDAACAGSLAAIKLAISDLLEHRSEVMISGGVCCDNSPFMYMSFSKTPAFTTGEDIRPFDNDSKGMMIGEGIGMMAFKRLEDAERDGDKIYAVLKGIGTSSDGRFKSIYAPRPDGQAKALKRAYADAGFDPHTCGLIEAHGTGTKAGDAAEFGGLVKHFSADNEQKQHIALGSVKSQIGHTKAAAGSAGMIKAVLALHHKVLPATIHIDQPNTALDIEQSPMYLNNETRPWMAREDGVPRRAGISSFGFGGTNYHMVLEEYRPTASGQYRLNAVPQTILITAANESALVVNLTEWQAKLNVNSDAQAYVFNALVTENTLQTPAADLARCGFVAKNAAQAINMIAAALKQFTAKADSEEWSVPTGVYFRKSGLAVTGKVVALFSGQGSQYVNMGRELACNFPSVMQAAQDMDSEFANAGLGQLTPTTYPIPVFSDDARKAQEEALRLTQHAQPAIGTLSVGLYKTFTNAGFKADFTAGHSFGELTALWAAGVINDSDYLMLARSRGQAMAAPKESSIDTGTMIAVVGSPEKVAIDIKDINDISIANYNSNNQVVVAGVTSQIAIAIDELKAKGYKVVPLPVSAAFHTPLVGHAQKPFAAAIDNAKFNKPSVPVYSNGTAKAHPSNANDIKKSLKNHILESVHFNEEIDNIYADGGRVFVEFGPKNVLTKLVENILKEKDDVVAIAVNANPKKSADMQMRQAAVQMAVLGLTLNEIDPYCAVKRPLVAAKMSPLAMKLTGASYVSAKTSKAFDDALNDGWKVKQATSVPVAVPTPQVVEKIVEVERIVEVEKIVYLNADGTVAQPNQVIAPTANTNTNNTDANSLASSIERSVSQFVDHQQQLLNVHEQYMQGPKDYAKTFDTVLSSQEGKELPESLDRTLGMYHDFQSETLRVHEQYLNNQTDNMTAMLSTSDNSIVEGTVKSPAEKIVTQAAPKVASASRVAQIAPAAKPTSQMPTSVAPFVHSPVVHTPIVNSAPVASVQALATAVAIAPIAETVVAISAEVTPTATVDLATIQTVMMEVVAEKTGYPTEMLELEMDMEADLGIDSIKRVEILGSVQELIPDLPELNPEDLAELRTLGEIVNYMKSKAASAAPALHLVETTDTTTTIDLGHIQSVMMDVVAEKTGYPTEMLELGMDMEADLGIDSIKRVEILGAVQETIADLPELNPEDLAELRTLGEIVSYMQSKVSAAPAPVAKVTSAAATAPAIDTDYIQKVMMEVVAEKTGYPTEMLELDMDMEADLGIDSIKRVEILGAVQETIADLPELNPEDLAELRTLGEIVSYMQSKVSAAPAPVAEVANAPVAATGPSIDTDYIQKVMMEVVAEKTGYPTEMLELGMDMEADLGIDSIKRVEILGAVQETIPDLPELNPEDLAELRTLGEIVSYMQSKVSAAPAPIAEVANAPVAATAPVIDTDYIQKVMMEVVAEKTGYPAEMLELAMDMEADLGIDSIKRVEILGAVQETIPDLPELNPEDLAELRTLGEIVSYMQSKVAPTEPTPPGAKASVPAPEKVTDVAASFQGSPSATVELTALSSINKIVQDVTQHGGANALIVDDGTGAAVALSSKLVKAGWNVTALKPNWLNNEGKVNSKKAFAKSVNVIEIGNSDKTLDEAQVSDIIEKNEQLDTVIYLQSSNPVDAIEYPEAAKQGLMLAFVLAKLSKVKAATKARASFVVVTRQGGTLGFANNDDSATQVKADVNADLVQAGLAGLVKTINHEWNTGNDSVFCRVVDLSAKLAADKAATIISDELLDIDTSIVEVAYDTDNLSNNIGKRLTLTGVATDSYQLTAGTSINSDSVFLVSGGAKGVTAHCVIEIAKQYQSKFILLGRSSFDDNEPSWAKDITDEVALKKAAMQALIAVGDKPTPVKVTQFVRPVLANREIAQTLNAIKAAGGQAQYVAADVTNSSNVSAGVAPIAKEFGEVTGIIHGAGVLADKFIEQKTLEEFNAVYTTKIDGLLSLLAATNTENVKHLVLFSSAAGFYGNSGQSDYSIANDILNKTAYRFKALNPTAQVLSFNWGPWDGGMVTPELKRMFNGRGVYIIPLDAGAKLLVSELAAENNRCAQILVGNDLSKDQATDEAGAAVKKPQVSRLNVSVNKTLLATNNDFLADHTIGDDQVFPTVCAIAWMRDASEKAYQGYHYQGLENYKLFKGIVFDGNEASEYQIELSADVVDDGARLVVETKISSINGQGKVVFHYGANLTLVNQRQVSPKVDLTRPTSAESAKEIYTNGSLFHGASLQGISEILECNEQGLLLRCQVPAVAVEKQGDFPLSNSGTQSNIFANDLAYQAMLVWVKKELGLGSLPSSTQGWTVYREVTLNECFYLKLTVVKSSGKGKQRGALTADMQLISENNEVLSEITSAKVTASANLNDLFLPKIAITENTLTEKEV